VASLLPICSAGGMLAVSEKIEGATLLGTVVGTGLRSGEFSLGGAMLLEGELSFPGACFEWTNEGRRRRCRLFTSLSRSCNQWGLVFVTRRILFESAMQSSVRSCPIEEPRHCQCGAFVKQLTTSKGVTFAEEDTAWKTSDHGPISSSIKSCGYKSPFLSRTSDCRQEEPIRIHLSYLLWLLQHRATLIGHSTSLQPAVDLCSDQ
jgi:hypothetical protein